MKHRLPSVRYITMWLTLLGSIFVFTHGFSSSVAAQAAPLRAAALLPLTGSAADQGLWIKEGLELAAEDLNHEGIIVDLLVDDTQAEPAKGVAAFQSLHVKGLPPIVFTYGSGVGMAISSLANKEKVLQMGLATGTDKYTSPEDFTFRNYARASEDAAFVSKMLAQHMTGKSVAFLWIENENGVSTATAARQAARENHVKEVFAESFLPGTTDFRTLLTKLKSQNPDLIILLSYPAEGNAVLKQVKEMRIEQTIIAFNAIISGPAFTEVARMMGPQLHVVFQGPIESPNSKILQEKFAENYKRKFGYQIALSNSFGPRAYAAFTILARMSKSCPSGTHAQTTASCLKGLLLEGKTLSTEYGDIAFDRNGDVKAGFRLLTWKNDAFILEDSVSEVQH